MADFSIVRLSPTADIKEVSSIITEITDGRKLRIIRLTIGHDIQPFDCGDQIEIIQKHEKSK